MKKYYRLIYCSAVGALIWVAAASALAAAKGPHFAGITPLLRAVGIVQVWGLMAFGVWRRPEKWGFRLGVFLSAVLLLQIYLWRLAMLSPRHIPGVNYSLQSFALAEIPLVIAVVSCLLLKWACPRIPEIPRAPVAGN